MANRWWVLAALAVAGTVSGQVGTGVVDTEVLCGEDGTACREVAARIQLDGGVAADLKLSFSSAAGLTSDSFALDADLVDPRDPQLRARLPAGTFIPSDFPVLLQIDPTAGTALSFRGRWSLELVTDNLEFSSRTPARLFRAPNGGTFQDISVGLGSGSLRILAGGSDFSEFLIAQDLRPFSAVIDRKLSQLQAAVTANATEVDEVLDELQGFVDQARAAFESGDLSVALTTVNGLLAFVRDNSGTEIPDLTELGRQRVSAAAQLLSAGSTLAHSLLLGLQSAQGGMSGFSRTLQVDAERSLQVAVRFEESFDIRPAALQLETELIDVNDPAFLARLPSGVQVPADFPVLLRINPDPASDQAFSGKFEIELVTDSLSFLGGTPLRLFKAPDGGAFEDVTRSLGLGSLRILAGGSDFSEFVIAADLRPIGNVVGAKLARLESFLESHQGAIASAVRLQLQTQLAQIRSSIEQGLVSEAIDNLDQFQETVRSNSGDDIPALWRSSEPPVNVAGGLRAIGDSLRFSLGLQAEPPSDPADVNLDGRVDIEDVLHLIGVVFDEQP